MAYSRIKPWLRMVDDKINHNSFSKQEILSFNPLFEDQPRRVVITTHCVAAIRIDKNRMNAKLNSLGEFLGAAVPAHVIPMKNWIS